MGIDNVVTKLKENIDKNNIYINEPMSKHTSFRVGGPADIFVVTTKKEEMEYILKLVKEENIPLTIVGNGTNLLVQDVGIRGIVLKPNLKYIEKEENLELTVGAGTSLALLAREALNHSLTGLEFAGGIPGTVGGAVLMNAGAYGGELKDVVVHTTYMDYNGKVHTINNSEHEFIYRGSIFSKIDAVILETKIKLEKGDKRLIEEKMNNNLLSRKETQPLEFPSAGSTFKRGDDFVTAKLIDEAGLKGYSIGGAEVSTKHAGFIINKGTATAEDILKLIEHVKKEVYNYSKKQIELEIKIV